MFRPTSCKTTSPRLGSVAGRVLTNPASATRTDILALAGSDLAKVAPRRDGYRALALYRMVMRHRRSAADTIAAGTRHRRTQLG